jgi:ferritin
MKFYTYLNSQGEHITLGPSKKLPDTFKSLIDMYQQALKHEQYITSCINQLMEQAVKEKDHGSQIFLQWFITEQIEEEENDRDIIAKLKLIGDNGQGLLMLDNELATRIFTPPAQTPA